jgi:hypothetical protein
MKNKWLIAAISFSAVAAVQFMVPAQAQLSMPSMPSMSSMGNMGSMGGASALPSVSSASPTNIAGILQYCVQNNDLGGASASSASSVQSSLLSKYTGSSTAPTSNSAYTSGSNGELQTGNGQTTSLGGSGLKAEATQKVCSMVLSHAKSLI